MEMNMFGLTDTTLSIITAAFCCAVRVAVAAIWRVVLLVASSPTGGWGCAYKQALIKQVCFEWIYVCRCLRESFTSAGRGAWRWGVEGDKSRQVLTDVVRDPRLISRHAGVNPRRVGIGTAIPPAGDTSLNPHCTLLTHHWTSRVTLQRGTKRKTKEMFFCFFGGLFY